MPFTITKVAGFAPFQGHPGKLILNVRHSGAYTRATEFSLASLLPRGLDIQDLVIPPPQLFPRTNVELTVERAPHRYGPITGCTVTGGRAVVTVASGHGLVSGERVAIRQVLGSTEINGSNLLVEVLTATTFALPSITAITAFSASADSIIEVARPLSRLTVTAATTAGVLTSNGHGLKVGDMVYLSNIAGLTGPTKPVLGALHEVATVPTVNTFTLKGLSFGGGAFSGTTYLYPVRSLRKTGLLTLRAHRTIGVAGITIATPPVFTATENHDLQVGDRVHVASVLNSTLAAVTVTGKRVRTVPSATTFTVETEAGAVLAGAGAHTANSGVVAGVVELATNEEFYGETVLEILLQKNANKLQGPMKL